MVVALLALVNGRARNPLTPVELFRMIDPPSFMSRYCIFTVKKAPQTLTLNVSSEPFSVMEPRGLLSSLTPALAKEDIDMTFSFLPVGCMPTCRFVRIMVILVKSPLICYLSTTINRSLYPSTNNIQLRNNRV